MQWSHFQSSVRQSLQDLRHVEELFDVTLVCDDGKQLNAHKVVLSACSPLFRQMLTRNKHPHPLIFMTESNSKQLEEVLDFLYNGEVGIQQEYISEFLKLAQKLKIKGLDELDFTEKSSNGQMKKSSTPLTKIKGSRKHQCPECDKYFLTSPILKEHLLSHKNKTTGAENISEVSKETKNSENIYLNTVVIQELGK